MTCKYARCMTSADRGRSARDNDGSVGGIRDELAYAGRTRSLQQRATVCSTKSFVLVKLRVVPAINQSPRREEV
jgi:hypothetical protein